MRYLVVVTVTARANIAAAYQHIAERSPTNAAVWVQGLYEQIDRLEEFPRRFGAAREQAHFAEELRQVVFKSHRIIFTVDDSSAVVRVLYVRHASMRAVGEPDDAEQSPPADG
jgi:plasmid stabilization system protein ParE